MSGLISWVRGFLTTLYVSVVIKDNQCYLYSRAVKGDKIISSNEAVFDVHNGVVDYKLVDYLKKRTKQYHSVYLAAMLNSPKQWALPAVDARGFEKFNISYNLVAKIKMKGWSIVVPDSELASFEETLNGLKPDLIYSPFGILHSLVKESPKKGKILYMLHMNDNNTIMIFDGEDMKFGAYFDTRKENDGFDYYDKVFSKEESADLDNVIEEEQDRLSKLGGLGDIGGGFSDFDNVDKDDFEDIQHEEIANANKKLEDSVRDIGKEVTLISNIKLAITEYYQNKNYLGDFIESVVIFDGLSLDNEFLIMAENELMLDIKLIKQDIDKLINNMMIREICNEL